MSRDHSMSLDPTALTDNGAGLDDGTGSNFYISGKAG
jgi:hypothetical protein